MTANGQIKIEQGVPMPGPAARGRHSVAGMIKGMAVGDMVFVALNGKTESSVRNLYITSARDISRSTGQPFKVATRKFERDGVKGIGIWRIA